MTPTYQDIYRRTVTPVQDTLAPFDRPFFDLMAAESQFLKETGTTIGACQAKVLERLRSREVLFNDELFDAVTPDEATFDPAISRQIERIEKRVQSFSGNSIHLLDSNDAPYGVIADDLHRSHQLRLKLDRLVEVVGQEPLRSITAVHSFIPAALLEGPGALGFSPDQMVHEFLYDFWRAFAESGFSFVRLIGWLELARIEDPTGDKADCRDDYWLYRGRDFFQIKDAPARSDSLHLHCYGLARRAGRWASGKEITNALQQYFPGRDAVMTREFDLKKAPATNIGRIGRYRSKLMGDVAQGRNIPSAKELAANVRFWSRCATQSRDFSIAEDWPETGPRLPKPLDDPDLMKRVSDAWSDAEKAWTPASPFLPTDIGAR
jgi:hypothetical protein